jgi:siroheme synthase-like protein
MIPTYPIFLVGLDRRRCVVLGGGDEAERKAEGLLAAGAQVVVIAEEVTEGLRHRADAGRIEWIERDYRRGDLQGAFLAIGAGFDREQNAAAWEEAEAEHVLMNAMDDVEHCSYIAGSVVQRGPLVVSISTSGCAPALAVRLREKLERMLGAEYGLFLRWMWDLREVMANRYAEFSDRRRAWYRLVDSDVLTLLGRGRTQQARRRLDALLDEGAGGPIARRPTDAGNTSPPERHPMVAGERSAP